MATTPAYYTAESRTVTPGRAPGAVVVQSWKRAASAGHDPRLIAQEARTASTDINAGRSFDMVLADERAVRSRGFEGALAMSENAPNNAAAPSSSFSFDDVIDVINPLHHLPVIGMIYRELTGDKIGPVAQIVGGGLFGGPIGAVSGTVNAVVQETTGKDLAGNVIALVAGDDGTFSAPDAAPGAIDRDNPEMALAMADAQMNGTPYLPAPVTPQNANASAQMRTAANAYQRTAGNYPAPAMQGHTLPPIDVDYYQQSLNASANAQNETILAMPATPVFGGLY